MVLYNLPSNPFGSLWTSKNCYFWNGCLMTIFVNTYYCRNNFDKNIRLFTSIIKRKWDGTALRNYLCLLKLNNLNYFDQDNLHNDDLLDTLFKHIWLFNWVEMNPTKDYERYRRICLRASSYWLEYSSLQNHSWNHQKPTNKISTHQE